MGVRRGLLMSMAFGILLGAVLYGLQVSLAGFNDVVRPSRPLQLWSAERIAAGGYQLEILGSNLVVRFPEDEWVRRVKNLD
jgi:hypothetical protein